MSDYTPASKKLLAKTGVFKFDGKRQQSLFSSNKEKKLKYLDCEDREGCELIEKCPKDGDD